MRKLSIALAFASLFAVGVYAQQTAKPPYAAP
jgi:hypothetical protein